MAPIAWSADFNGGDTVPIPDTQYTLTFMYRAGLIKHSVGVGGIYQECLWE